ncbi:telomerase Cajal body protein 1 homolog [Drosophila montana]|uniref:telomerase Cajal body protein 1 homolog n=1 Tax=Drosophila montana TaxID=40370 RepID=UPI00313B2EC5
MDGESSANASVAMSDMEQTSPSLLNHNVSFNSSMELTLPAAERTFPDLSFSLSETERRQLKQYKASAEDSSINRSQRSALKDVSNNLSCSIELEECSGIEEESEHVISVDDTVDELLQPQEEEMVEQEISSTTVKPQSPLLAPATLYFERQLLELGRRCWPSTAEAQHYTKGCYWSPDGTCLLSPVHLDGMHVMELPLDLYEASDVSIMRSLSQLQSAVHVPEGGTVYDCVWYPLMNSQQPETCFWLATRQHEPIHMWDAFDGRLRCSYSGYDQVDEVVAAISLAFAHDGQKIYAGYKRCIKIFDTNRPGRVYDEYAVKFAISCMAQTAEHPHTVTCGNWKGYIQHFDLRCAPKQGPLFTLGGHTAGITQLRYGTDAGAGNWQLFSGARKCPKLLQWDMRNYKKPLREFQRQVKTNQRIQFDLNPEQTWLASGDTEGGLNLWNLEASGEPAALQLPLHGDCCNGISFHPNLPILATSSGQYHFIAGGDKHEDCNSTSLADSTEIQQEQKSTVLYENAVLLLWCGHSSEN